MGILRSLAGRTSLNIEIQGGGTVSQIIEKLIGLVGRTEFAAAIVDRDLNDPRPNALIIVNNKEISALDGVKTQLKNSDEMVLVPISHGG